MRGTERLRNLIAASRQAVVFTGAGISTESGIADFRSPGGNWSRHKPIYFEDFMARGIVKTATISFDQAMPPEAMRRAAEATLACDLFLAAGSSLVVHPAAGFPELARRNGARLIILNRDPTPLDSLADLVLNAEIGPTLTAAVDADYQK